MSHIWRLEGYANDDRLVSSIPLPRVLWPLLSEVANIPEPERLNFDNCAEWDIDEAHARALARAAMGIELPQGCVWQVGPTKVGKNYA